MPEFVADFHIHSRYSRACSKDLSVKELARWARIKGIGVLGTGDFTHPLWLQELLETLRPTGQGLFEHDGVRFLLTAEVNTLFYVRGLAHNIHHVLLAPSFESVERINRELESFGTLTLDGRPILRMDAARLVEVVLGIEPRCLIVPAHCLTPDSYIHTGAGIAKIKDVRVGDLVYAHSGRLQPVTEVHVRPYRGPLYHIRPFYFRLGLETTPEHPFYAIKTYKHCSWTKGDCRPTCAERTGCRKRPYERYAPQWVPAREIECGDVLVFPRFLDAEQDVAVISLGQQMSEDAYRRCGDYLTPIGTKVTKIRGNVPVDATFCRLMGYYLAEGYTDGRSHVSFCFRDGETAYIRDVQEIMRTRFGVSLTGMRNQSDNQGLELIYSSKILYHFFSQQFYWNGHNTAAYKALPQWVLQLPRPKQAEIVRGWWRGDTGYTSSRVLMNQFKIMLLRLGIIPSILVDRAEQHRARGRHDYAGRTIRAQHDSFQFSNLSFFDDAFGLLSDPAFRRFKTKMSRRHGWMDDRNIYIPVRDVSVRPYEGSVYNLEVAGDNSYVAEFATVHNCWTPHFSIFGSNSGFDSVEQCFGKQAGKIFALETGLSSDPAMNWRLSKLDRYTLISNSDSHCLHPSTFVYTVTGRPEPISRLASPEILSLDLKGDLRQRQARHSALHKMPCPPWLVKVSTKTKHITCTPEHRFFVLSGEEIVEKAAGLLKTGDLVATLRRYVPHSHRVVLPPMRVDHHLRIKLSGIRALRTKRLQRGLTQRNLGQLVGVKEDCIGIFERGKVKCCKETFLQKLCSILEINVKRFTGHFVYSRQPKESMARFSNRSLAQVLGYALGDGGNKYSENRLNGFAFTDKDLEILSVYRGLMKETFKVEGKIKQHSQARSFSIRYPRFVGEYLQHLSGDLVAPSPSRRVPEIVFRLPQEQVAAFLRGLFDAEGTVGHHWVSVVSSSQVLVQDVRTLLLRFEISTYLYPNFERTKKRWRYNLFIYGQESLRRFAEHIGFGSSKKQRRLSQYLASITQEPKSCFVDPLPLHQSIKQAAEHLGVKVTDLPKKLQYHWYNGHAARRNTVLEFVELFTQRDIEGAKVQSTLRKLRRFSESDLLWEPVEAVQRVPADCEYVYDLTVPVYENYVANGFVTHNSARRIGREANVFNCEPSYDEILGALKARDRTKFLYTIEFFPEEGKYHYDGHRNCRVSMAPKDSKRQGLLCPVCGRKVTVGVMHRVDDLADRAEGAQPPHGIPFKNTVPLEEIIADALGVGVGTQAVDREYFNLIERCGSEFDALLKAPEEALRKAASAKVADGILRMRRGEVQVEPGYDGEYGKVKIFGAGAAQFATSAEQQMTLF